MFPDRRGPMVPPPGVMEAWHGHGTDPLIELRDQIRRLSFSTEHRARWASGMRVIATTRVARPSCGFTGPTFAVSAQGTKRITWGSRRWDCGPGQYLVTAPELPVTAQIAYAGPYLGFVMPVRPELVVELLDHPAAPIKMPKEPEPAVAVAAAEGPLIEAIVRLLKLIDRPRDFAVLAPTVEREIHWRLLNGPQAAVVRRLGRLDGPRAVARDAATWIRDHFDQVIRISDLADHVRVSVPTLNRHFRAATALTPLQYQKQLRLQRARAEIIGGADNVAAVGHMVGYRSPSQFTREYRRMFGVSPGRDAPGHEPGAMPSSPA